MKNQVAHFLSGYLAKTDRFIYELTQEVPGFTSAYFARSQVSPEKFPAEKVVIKANESLYDGELKSLKPRLIHAHCLENAAAALIYCLRLHVPLIVSVYDHDLAGILQEPSCPQYLTPLFEYASRFLVASDLLRERLKKAGCPARKIIMLKRGLDLKLFKALKGGGAERKTRFLMSVGREASTIIDAFYKLSQKYADVELIIVGAGSLMPEIVDRIIELRLARQVKTIPLVDEIKFRKYLSAADVFLFAGTTATNESLSTPLSVMEAAAARLAVAAVNESGVSELVQERETGLLVPEQDVDAWYENLEKLHIEPDFVQKLGAAGQKFMAENHDQKKISRELSEIYKDCIDTPPKKLRNFPESSGKKRKALLIRAAPLMGFLYKLFYLKEVLPDYQFYVLTSTSSLEFCRSHPLVEEVVPFTGKRFSPLNLERKLRKRLSREGFDKVIVPLINANGEGFENVMGMAKLIKAKEVKGLSENNLWLEISWLKLLRSKYGLKFWLGIAKKTMVSFIAGLAIIFLSVVYLILKIIGLFVKTKDEFV